MRLAVNGRFLAAPITGVQRVARRVVAGLAERVDVTLYVPGGVERPTDLDGLRRVVPGILRGVPWEQLELPARTLRNGTELSLDPANAGPVLGGRRVMILHDVFPITHPEWYTARFRAWFRLGVARTARGASRIVMFSEWAKREAVRALGLQAARIVVAAQGTAPFEGPPSERVLRSTLAQLGLRPGYILATGHGDPRKNTRFLLEVVRSLDLVEPPTVVLTGVPFRHIHPVAGMEETLPARRLGFVSNEELRALYAGAAVFCFPSRGEGFGRPPLEAMACGAPVVAADYGCAREVLGNAAMIRPLEPRAWAEALDQFLGDPSERERWSRAGRAHAARFRWEDTARQVLEACRAAAAEGAEPHESVTASRRSD